MKVSTHDIGLENLDNLSSFEALCLFIREDERPLRGIAGFADWRLCGKLSRLLLDEFFVGQRMESLLLPSEHRLALPRIFAFGVGMRSDLAPPRLSELLAHTGHVLARAGIRNVALELPGAGVLSDEERVALWAQSFPPTFRGQEIAVLIERSAAKLIPDSLPSAAA